MHMFRDKWVLAFLSGLVLGAFGLYVGQQVFQDSHTDEKIITEYYRTENAVHVSPHSLRGKMDKGDQSFVLVDLRSAEEYEKEHIIGAVNIPAYKDKYTSAYGDIERIVDAFSELKARYPDRDLIVYCYSGPCMTGRKVGEMLVEHDIYVKHLNIGWYEWRHDWNSWNHEHEWNTTTFLDYVVSGKEPGVSKGGVAPNPCIEGDLGC